MTHNLWEDARSSVGSKVGYSQPVSRSGSPRRRNRIGSASNQRVARPVSSRSVRASREADPTRTRTVRPANGTLNWPTPGPISEMVSSFGLILVA